jgi:DNA-binding response OmpR family regulator
MKARILVIEDMKEMGELIRVYLEKEGCETELRETAEEGLEAFREGRFDLIILDINLPGIDGFEFLQRLRRQSDVPVMIVSARDSDEDMILGLGIGADEFVTKPFSPKVLIARVRAMLRRVSSPPPRSLSFGPFVLDLDGGLLVKGRQRVPLSSREFEVLAFLATQPGRVFSPQSIYEGVWKNQYGDVTAVGVYMQRLRRKIEEDPARPRFLQTVHGMGYRFDPEGRRP